MSGLFPKAAASSSSSSSKNDKKKAPRMPFRPPMKTSYISPPVSIPSNFLAPLPDASTIKVTKIDFANSPLPEYKFRYAVILDNVLTQEECTQIIHYAERSVGAHLEYPSPAVPNDSWKPALVNVGGNYEVLMQECRHSDRIIWDQKELTNRLWTRVLQGEGMKDYFLILDGESYEPVIGQAAVNRGERWVATKQGINERLRFLKYGAGQYFRPQRDGAYTTPDGSQTSWYTIHLYLNDSAQALGISDPEPGSTDPRLVDSPEKPAELLRGGATTFHRVERVEKNESRLDVDPKAGRVLIFQHRGLEHSGDEVRAGVRYTLRSDLMYEFEGGSDG